MRFGGARLPAPTAESSEISQVRILLADVHGGYTDSFVAGDHEYWFPPPEATGRGGLARLGGAGPPNAYEMEPERLTEDPPDLVVLQRLEDVETFEQLTGRRAGAELPADLPRAQHPES